MNPLRRIALICLLLFVASVPLEDAVQLGAGRISKVLGALSLGAWIVAALGAGQLRRPTRTHLVAYGFVTWAAASYFWAARPAAALPKILTLVQLALVVVVVWDLVTSQRRVVLVLRAYLVGAALATGVIVLGSRRGAAVEGLARFAPGEGDPNSAGCMLAIGVAVAWYLLTVERDVRVRLLVRAFIPFATVGVALTGSRTALLALTIVALLAVSQRSILRPARLAGGVLVVLAALVAVDHLVPAATIDRLGTTEQELEGGTFNERTSSWDLAIETFGEHPIAGIGSDMFLDRATARGQRAHNVFLGVAAELGVVGLVLLLTTLGLTTVAVSRRAPAGTRRPWAAIGATWLVGAMSLNWDIRKVTWLLLAVALAHAGRRHEPVVDPATTKVAVEV